MTAPQPDDAPLTPSRVRLAKVVSVIVAGEQLGRSDFAIRGMVEYVFGSPLTEETLQKIRLSRYYAHVRMAVILEEAGVAAQEPEGGE